MRRTSGTGPEGHGREAAARCYGETTAQKAGALSCREGAGYRNRPTTVARTSTHCGSPLDGKRAQLTPRFLQSKSTARRWWGNRKVLQRRFRNSRRRRLDEGIFGGIERVGMGDGCAVHRGQASLLQTSDRRQPVGARLARDKARMFNPELSGPTVSISWPWPAADHAPNGCGGLCRARTARRRSPRRGSAAPTARCRSGRGWPG
ncbi:hypothetical protein SAMN05216585_3006 [Pseudomonas chlororaphis]|nr:hypothetical protein SAMN05216585_3006 [Pseudomonas chlororaphis]